ncbi:MAG: biopolymer transporter ExbD [Verrucomicrobiota bacterium]
MISRRSNPKAKSKSNRKSEIQSGSDDSPSLDMSSLIDVSFLLLIFFIATSTLQPREADLGMQLPVPNSSAASIAKLDLFEIKIEADGAVIGNDETLDADSSNRELPQLRDRLKTYKAAADLSDSQTMVIVNANDHANSQRFLDVLNCLARLKIENVSFPVSTNS